MNRSGVALPEGDTRREEEEAYNGPLPSNHSLSISFHPNPHNKTRTQGISTAASIPIHGNSSTTGRSFDGNPHRSTSGCPFDGNFSTSGCPFDGNLSASCCPFDGNSSTTGCPFDGNLNRSRSSHPFDGNSSTSGRPFEGNPNTNSHPSDGNPSANGHPFNENPSRSSSSHPFYGNLSRGSHSFDGNPIVNSHSFDRNPNRQRSSHPFKENSSTSSHLFDGNLSTSSDHPFNGNPSTSSHPFDGNPSRCRSSHPSKENSSRNSLSIDRNLSTSGHLFGGDPSRSRSGHLWQDNSSRSSGSRLFGGSLSTSSHLFDRNPSRSRSSHLWQESSSRSSSHLFEGNSTTSSHIFDENPSRSSSRSGHISKGNSSRSSPLFDRDSSANSHFLDRNSGRSSHPFDGNSSRSSHLLDRGSSRSSLPLNGNSSRSSHIFDGNSSSSGHLFDGNSSRSSSSCITRLPTTDILKSQPARTRVQESSSSSGKGRIPSPNPNLSDTCRNGRNPSTNLSEKSGKEINPSTNPSTNLSEKSGKERNPSTNLNGIARLPTTDILKSQPTRTNPSPSSNSNPSTDPIPSINPNSNPLKFSIRKFSFSDPVIKDLANLPGHRKEDYDTFLDPSSPYICSNRVTEKTAMDSNKRSSQLESEPGVLAKNAFLVGFYNQGNTCYLNSCLQCLVHTRPLLLSIIGTSQQFARKTECIQKKYKEKYCTNSSSLAEALASSFWQLIKDLSVKPSYSVASAADFLRRLQAWAPQFSGYQQQDAQEVLRAILDGLHEALNKAKLRGTPKYQDVYKDHEFKSEAELAEIAWSYHKAWNDSVIQDIFCGQLQSTIVCSVCQRKSHCFDPFLDLSLPLPKHGTVSPEHFRSSDQWRVTIQDCLSLFMAPEMLSGSNKYHCPSCKASQICTKQLSIYRTPLILVLHLKRFYGSGLHSFQKDNTPVSYPINGLDLTKFLWRAPTITGGLTQNAVYDLYATCNHSGSISSGHYTAQCKNTDDKYYSFNDSDVSTVQDSSIVTSSAYILFYQQRRC